MSDDILEDIDDVLADWNGSPDSARWSPDGDVWDAVLDRWPRVQFTFTPADPARLSVAANEFRSALDRMTEAIQGFGISFVSFDETHLWMSRRAQHRPTHAADRTMSTRRRAGSRRNRRYQRR